MVYHPAIPTNDPSDTIFEFQVAQYVYVACLTLCVWDWLLALSDELEMIYRGGRRLRYFLNGVYLVARICPIIYLTAIVSLENTTIPSTCRMVARFVGVANIMIMPAVSGLFYFRLSAVYSRDKYVMTFFGFCWLVILGFFVFDTITLLTRFSHGGSSSACFAVMHSDAWGYIATAVYDTLMYLAISWQLASFAIVDGWTSRVGSFVVGGGLGGLSKILLRSGQVYYFMTIGFSIGSIILIYSPSTTPQWNGLLLEPNITVASIMACRLFRELKLDLFASSITEREVSKIVFRDIGAMPRHLSGNVVELHPFDAGNPEPGFM